jgi:hypothetical protein
VQAVDCFKNRIVMKFKLALIATAVVSLSSCKSGNSQYLVDMDKFQYPNWYEAEMLPEWEDTDSLNTARTQDNKIYLPHRVFEYDYTLVHKSEPDKPLYSVVFFNDSCLMKKMDCIAWSIDSTLDFSSIKRYPVENIELLVYKTRGQMDLANTQTIIRYDYTNRKGKILFGSRTGVKENENGVFLHPPRAYAFKLTEFCAFPWYKTDQQEWPGEIHIPSYWANDVKLDLGTDDLSAMRLHYTKQGKETISTTLGDRLCEKVIATAENDNLQTQLTYWYDEELGFVQMDYILPKGYLMTLKLVEVREP